MENKGLNDGLEENAIALFSAWLQPDSFSKGSCPVSQFSGM